MRKVAIIGAGIGAQHLKGYQEVADLFDVTMICDLDPERGRDVAGDIPFTTSYDDVLQSDVDIIDVCLPPHLHLEASLKALDAGKHVICEKPLVASVAEADELIAKSKTTGLNVFPVFQYRFGLGTSQLRALQAKGLTGKPFVATLETHWNRPASYYDIDWRGTWEGERGGAILGHAIHIHDLLTSFLGPVASVHAELATSVNKIEVEDCAALSIRMENGALVTSSVTLGAADDMSRFRLVFKKVTVESDHAPYSLGAKAWSFTARAPYGQGAIDEVLADVTPPKLGYAGMFTEIAGALDGKPSDPVTLEDGRRSLEFVTAVYASARSGQPQALPIDQAHPLYQSWMP